MCGICGIFVPQSTSRPTEYMQAVKKMTDLMVRRGPDDEGYWEDTERRFFAGFRRLAILDLTNAGRQPMHSSDNNSVLVFNGELYNFQDIRHELENKGIVFQSRTDTEVVLEALNLWGIDALDRFNGMFAFAWYNRLERQLLLARDHAGIKPLYYYLHPEGIAFASQFNCLLQTPWGNPGEMRLDVLKLYLHLHHIPSPYGLLENTFQLEPGHYLLMRADGSWSKRAWWTLPRDPDPNLSGEDALEELQSAIDDAIRRQRISDVPLGVFLSGGVDSPLVTAVARKQTDSSLKAFTIGNPGWWQDEAQAATAYAKHLDIDHRIHNISGIDAHQMIQAVAQVQHEPFGDYSILPTLLVSEAARTELTVALSGDGGDELFWGYERPLSLLRNGTDFRLPWLLRIGMYGAGKYGLGPKRSSVIVSKTPGHYYFGVNSRLRKKDLQKIAPDLNSIPHDFHLYDFDSYRGPRHLANYSRYVEYYGQLQRGLKKVDMASMYHSLEVRVPLLDRKVIEVSLRLDPFDAMRNGNRKAHLRDLLTDFVPSESIPTPKRGFAVPLGDWLKKPLRPIIEDYLFDSDLYPTGVFDQNAIKAYCEEHFSDRRSNKWGIWTLLSLQMWARSNLVKQ